MELDALHAWLKKTEGFNDLELALDEHDDFGALAGSRKLRSHFAPLGFHRSGSWVALWREDATSPWGRSPMVWVDSEGSPWEVFARTPEEGLAMLALPMGTLYDALAAASRVLDGGADTEAFVRARDEWAARTKSALTKATDEYEPQGAHRAMLAQAGIALPVNAFETALTAVRAQPRLSEWLAAETGT